MALRTMVKVGSITNLSDARYCSGMEVDFLGFNIDSNSPNYVTPEDYLAIKGWISGPKFIVETDQPENANIEAYKFDLVQTSNQEIVEELADLNQELILQLDLGRLSLETVNNLLMKYQGKVKFFELIGADRSLDILTDLENTNQILLGFGVDNRTILDTLNRYDIAGISLKGSDEIKPGYKDYDELADILETLEIES